MVSATLFLVLLIDGQTREEHQREFNDVAACDERRRASIGLKPLRL
jgi:hypothetical protein